MFHFLQLMMKQKDVFRREIIVEKLSETYFIFPIIPELEITPSLFDSIFTSSIYSYIVFRFSNELFITSASIKLNE